MHQSPFREIFHNQYMAAYPCFPGIELQQCMGANSLAEGAYTRFHANCVFGSAVCKKGSSPSQDGSTCILDGVVNVGKKVYNDPQVQAGLQETQVRSPST